MTEEEIEKKLKEQLRDSAAGTPAPAEAAEAAADIPADASADTAGKGEKNVKKPLPGWLANALKILRDGVLDNNPVLVQLLGMCSTLATTTSVKNALGMGLATSAVLICSNIMISLLRRVIPKEVRIAAYVVIISGFVTAVELLMKAYLPELYDALGIFIPLIVVNCIILARAEAFASKNRVLPSALDGIATGIGYTFALLLISSIREILGSGTFCGHTVFGDGYSRRYICTSRRRISDAWIHPCRRAEIPQHLGGPRAPAPPLRHKREYKKAVRRQGRMTRERKDRT